MDREKETIVDTVGGIANGFDIYTHVLKASFFIVIFFKLNLLWNQLFLEIAVFIYFLIFLQKQMVEKFKLVLNAFELLKICSLYL